jgi:hypothetical protein
MASFMAFFYPGGATMRAEWAGELKGIAVATEPLGSDLPSPYFTRAQM